VWARFEASNHLTALLNAAVRAFDDFHIFSTRRAAAYRCDGELPQAFQVYAYFNHGVAPITGP
jgi:hypothetical protein